MSKHYIPAGARARIRVANPDALSLTFELTLTVAEWRSLAAELPDDGSDAGRLHKMIRTLTDGAISAIYQEAQTTGWSAYTSVTSAEAEEQ